MAELSQPFFQLRPIIFGELCLVERISVGGMAEVYRAKPFNAPNFDRLLAVKRILPNLAEDQEFIEMFLDEAKIAIELDHENICQMYELGKRGNSHYLVMEYIAGQDVLTINNWYRRRRRAMPPEQAAYVVGRVAAALGHAHDLTDVDGNPLGIVHRDVSPQNVLISYAGEVKLIDFGIAKVANRQTAETQVGVLKGKFGYMSPEQVTGRPIDHRADLFSLGTVFHELLTGRRLFATESDFRTLELVREARVEPPSSFNDNVPWQLDNIVLKALTRDPDKRYQKAQEIVRDLAEYMASLPQPYTKQRLSDWMVATFAEELAKERARRDLYRRFVTPEDVQAHNDRIVDELRRSLGAPEVDEGEPALEDWEITQVLDADYDQLIEELEESELEKGKPAEVLAERGALPRLLHEHSDRMLASIDLPEAREPEEIPQEMIQPHRGRPRSRARITLLAVVALSALGLLLWRGMVGDGVDSSPPRGMIMLEVTPPSQLQVFLDGRLVDTRAPVVMRGLESGEHTIEIRHADFETHRETVVVGGGRAQQLTVELIPLPYAEGTLELSFAPADAEVWLDQAPVPGDPGQRTLVLDARASHLIELRRSGYFPYEQWFRLTPDEGPRQVEVALTPLRGTLVLRSDPPGIAYVDGVEQGSTEEGLVVDGLDPAVPHDLRIVPSRVGFRAYQTTVVFDAAQEIALFPTLRRIGDDHPVDPTPFGYLSIDTGERWYRVLVDGRETGQTTPITVESPLALRAGIREIVLVRGHDRHSFRVDVGRDETTVVRCQVAEWNCGI